MSEGMLDRRHSRRSVLKSAAGAGAALSLTPLVAACGSSKKKSSTGGGGKAGGSITIGTFQDNALTPFQKVFLPQFTKETGIKVNYQSTGYDAWYTNSKNDGRAKTGAYDIYIMDDNWVPEYAANNYIQSLDGLGFKVNPDILAKGLDQGYWPPRHGAKLKDFASTKPELFAIVIIDDVEILYYNKDYFPAAPKTWDDIAGVAKAKFQAGKLYGWSARGVKGNPIVQTYLPLLNAYGGNFVNDDWTPGFAGPEGQGALERLLSFIPYMPKGIVEYDTNQEVQVLLDGKCTALTEYTGLSHSIDDPKQSKVVGKIDCAATPSQEKSGPAIGTFICGIASGAKNTAGAKQFLEWFTSAKIQTQFARTNGSAAVTGTALSDPTAVKAARWLPAIKDAVDNSVPKPRTPDEPQMENLLGLHLNNALVAAIAAKGSGFSAIAKSELGKAGNEIHAFLKQQGGYY